MKWEESRGGDMEIWRWKRRQELMRLENWEKREEELRWDDKRWKQVRRGRKEHKKRCDEKRKNKWNKKRKEFLQIGRDLYFLYIFQNI